MLINLKNVFLVLIKMCTQTKQHPRSSLKTTQLSKEYRQYLIHYHHSTVFCIGQFLFKQVINSTRSGNDHMDYNDNNKLQLYLVVYRNHAYYVCCLIQSVTVLQSFKGQFQAISSLNCNQSTTKICTVRFQGPME